MRTVTGAVAVGTAVALTGAWMVTAAVSLGTTLGSSTPAAPDEVLTLVVALAGVAAAAWLAVSLLLAVLGHLPGHAGAIARRCAERATPAAVRRVAAVMVGASLAGALAPGTATADGSVASAGAAPSPALVASPSGTPSPALVASSSPAPSPALAPRASAPAPAPAPVPGWTPERPVVRRQASPQLVATAPAADERPGIVVRRGDTLWDLVRHHLGDDASDAEVAAEWPRWYETNRAVIGPDPDALLPGQVLQAPVAAGALR